MMTQQKDRPRVLAIGDACHTEFETALRVLSASAEVRSIDASKATTPGTHEWDYVILFCPWPLRDGRVAQEAVRVAGGARCVQLLGVWCEGEERTGVVHEGFERVFWHAFPRWWRHELCPESPVAPYRCVVSARDEETRLAISESLAEYGALSVCEQAPLVGVWVGSQLSGSETDRLWSFCREMERRGAPVVSLLDFPRPETVLAARRVGAREVIGLPVDAQTLGESLAGLAATSARAQTSLGRQQLRAA